MITVFNVSSNRINDIKIPRGTRVGALRDILSRSGYDVKDAKIAVSRVSQGDLLVGENANYALQEGDTVEFKTREIDLPGLAREIEGLCEEKRPEPPCRGCKVVGCSWRVNGWDVDARLDEDGICVHVYR